MKKEGDRQSIYTVPLAGERFKGRLCKAPFSPLTDAQK
jgi:hypothetical protein